MASEILCNKRGLKHSCSCDIFIIVKLITVLMFSVTDRAKMEAGENPARSRHCIDGVWSTKPLGDPEKADQMMRSESGDMHESSGSRVGEARMDQYFAEQRKRAAVFSRSFFNVPGIFTRMGDGVLLHADLSNQLQAFLLIHQSEYQRYYQGGLE